MKETLQEKGDFQKNILKNEKYAANQIKQKTHWEVSPIDSPKQGMRITQRNTLKLN